VPSETEKENAIKLSKTNGIDFVTHIEATKDQNKGFLFVSIED
jgi:hypothetical protein